MIGEYASKLAWWLAFFPPERFLIVTSQQLRAPGGRVRVRCALAARCANCPPALVLSTTARPSALADMLCRVVLRPRAFPLLRMLTVT